MPTITDLLNQANPNKIDTGLQVLPLGDAMNLLPKRFRGVPVAATDILVLPNNAKCAVLLGGFILSGAVTGQIIPQQPNAVVGTTLFAAPNAAGDILLLAADAPTLVEVTYITDDGVLIEAQTVAVLASGVAQLPNGVKANRLISCTQVGGTVAGDKTIMPRGTAPATTEAEVSATGTITLLAADVGAAGAQALLTYVAEPGVGSTRVAVAAKLREDSPT